MAKLNRERMDESHESLAIRGFMRRHNVNLWEASRLLGMEACGLASVVLGESFVGGGFELRMQRAELEMLFNR